jgi:uroporphyrinogen decarboxylase
MKLIVHGPGGVLENVTDIVSYETLCFMLVENPNLARRVFDEVGARLVRYYERCRSHPAVGALISNDDWGFKTQTMISPAMMAEYVFPWHKKIVETIHGAGKPAILHSCGNLGEVMDVVIDELRYDAKHSFEDAILPIEDAYRRWGSRIAILGGIDVDFMCSADPQAIYDRSKAMLELAADGGGYALGSGNSIPEYVPDEAYFAMTRAAWE